jgi:N-acetylglucosaminyldiphosphoundecaprenol N-acetyl-beta-D-mannosaminyltransferase
MGLRASVLAAPRGRVRRLNPPAFRADVSSMSDVQRSTNRGGIASDEDSHPPAEGALSPSGKAKPRDSGAVSRPASRRVLGMRVDATSYAETTAAVLDLARGGHGGMVCCSNTHMAMESFDSPEFQRIVNAADRVTPDGVPIVWALRGLGLRDATRVYGPDLMPILCAAAEREEVPVGLYGGTEETLARLQQRLRERFPRLQIPFAWAPPFRPLEEEEDAKATEAIEAAHVGILFVGLGCPKQERWMAAHRERLPCVLVGVGAAFDFVAGTKSQAPRWMMRAGLEWLYRLCSEPRRLWRRYLVGNSRFLFHFLLRGNPC